MKEKPPGSSSLRGELLRLTVESISEGVVLLDGESRIADANGAAAKILGASISGLRGTEAFAPLWTTLKGDGSDVGPEGRRSALATLRSGSELEFGVLREDGSLLGWVEARRIAELSGDAGEPPWLLVALTDITERRRAQDRLNRKVRVLAAVEEYSVRIDGAALEDMASQIARASLEIFGASAAALATYSPERRAFVLQETAWAADCDFNSLGSLARKLEKGTEAPVLDGAYQQMLRGKVMVTSSVSALSFGIIPAAIGDEIAARLRITWLCGLALASKGQLFGGLVLAGRDRAEPPGAEELRVFAELTANAIMRNRVEDEVRKLLVEKELILQEVHHRVKNNMSTLISLLTLQARNIGGSEAREALKDATSRLQSMNTLYDKLFLAEDLREMSLKEYLPALCADIVGTFPHGEAVTLETDLDDSRFGIATLSNLGIMVNEIVSNSMKYAFPEGRRGTISLASRTEGERVIVEIGDDGPGLPEGIDLDSGPGFGLGLIRILAKQLDASISVLKDGGTRFAIGLPTR